MITGLPQPIGKRCTFLSAGATLEHSDPFGGTLRQLLLVLSLLSYETHNGGYIDHVALNRRDVNSSDLYGGRFDILLSPSDRLSFRLVGAMQNTAVDGFRLADYTLQGNPVNGSLDQSSVFPESLDQRFRLVSGTYEVAPNRRSRPMNSGRSGEA